MQIQNPLKALKETLIPQKPIEKSIQLSKAEIKKPATNTTYQKKKVAADTVKKKSFYEQRKFFESFIQKAGIDNDFDTIHKKLVYVSIAVLSALFGALIVFLIHSKTPLGYAIILSLSMILLGGLLVYLIVWMVFFVFVDMRIYQRKKDIEAVFPDFLQLTAANINAGMPIDRALWFAIRPKFGILAKEMEDVAKATMVGENLSVALRKFSNKYDSITIKRALNLLLEGLESGGEVGELLTRVANNIRDTEIIKKEMAASVTTYVIFILFATLGAAPFLFGLTTELIVIMKSILGGIQMGEGGGGMMAMSGDSIALIDYQIFAITSICISSIFAAIIISVIQKGNAKESVKNMPIYMAIGICNYLIAFNLMRMFLGGLFK